MHLEGLNESEDGNGNSDVHEESGDEVLYENKTVNDRFLEDPNSSAYIEEVLQA